jgi:calcineurin-like phosphoesterase family protein
VRRYWEFVYQHYFTNTVRQQSDTGFFLTTAAGILKAANNEKNIISVMQVVSGKIFLLHGGNHAYDHNTTEEHYQQSLINF